MKILIIADPIKKLNPKSDTTLSLTREALARNCQVFWTESQNVFFLKDSVYTNAQLVLKCEEQKKPIIKNNKTLVKVSDFTGVWIRKDPPFDANYVSLCWLLCSEETNTLFINKPSLLLRYHEKMLPYEALKQGYLNASEIIPTFIGYHCEPTIPFSRKIITKPWLGFAGHSIKKWNSLKQTKVEFSKYQKQKAPTIAQPYLQDAAQKGDRRVFFINGKRVGDFVRIPQKGKIQANLAQGGSAHLQAMTKQEASICKRLGVFLKTIGIAFAGVDILAGRVSEINITSPTGFETFHQLSGKQLAKEYLDLLGK